MANMQKKIPFGMPSLMSGFGMGMSLGYFTAGMMLQYQGSRLPLDMLNERCKRIDALMENPKAGPLYRLNETIDGGLLMEAAIRSNQFEKVASNLAYVIVKKGYGTHIGESFLYYYLEQVSNNHALEAANRRMALHLANAFEGEVNMLVSTPIGSRLNQEEQNWIINEAFYMQFSHNRPVEQTFKQLAEAYLKLPIRSVGELVRLISEFHPSQ